MSRRRSREAASLPQLFVRLIESAEHAGEDASGCDLSGAPDALRAVGAGLGIGLSANASL